jgi:catechol 2,3-dioxygenase-like lactoylglutathione lyase family enzyme
MAINSFDHYTLRCADIDASWRFYEKALGLHVIEREYPGSKAAKVQIGDTDVVHMFQATSEQDAIFARMAPTDEETAAWRTGRIHHVEFWATDLAGARKRLNETGTPFSERTLPDKHQISTRDPDGVAVGLNFPLSEVQSGS